MAIKYEDSLAAKNPELAAQWDYEANRGLTDKKGNDISTPDKVTPGTTQIVGWKMPYDDPKTGKHFDFTWQATIASRNNGIGCPYLSGHSVWPGFNDLATINPDLASQWDYEANEGLVDGNGNDISTPDRVIASSMCKVGWKMPYDDPVTGKHYEFKWQATVVGRNISIGCPYLSGKAVWPGFNDLATRNPELAAQWDYEANKGLVDRNGNDISTPDKVTPSASQIVGWKMPYDDPVTGKHYEFKWQATVVGRNISIGCPYLSGKAVWPGFNDLATRNPELAAQWDYEANKGLVDRNGNDISTPDKVTPSASQIVGWKMPYDDPVTGKHYEFKWQAKVANRNSGNNCPYLSGQAVWPGFNDLATVDPDLAAQWDYEANRGLTDNKGNDISTPDKVTASSVYDVGWKMPYDDPKTGKHFDFTWQARIASRNNGIGCPYLSGHSVWPGFNDLTTKNPDLAAQWDYEANRGLTDNKGNDISTPDKVAVSAACKVGWKVPYDDPETGKHYEFKWQAVVSSRNQNRGCPYIPPSCSKAESQVYMWLMDNNIDFVREQSYVGENGNRRFDVYLPQYNAAIEIDGGQHFSDVKWSRRHVSFDDLRAGDNERNEYCEQNGIALLRLPDFAFTKGKKTGTYPYDKIMSTFFGKDGSKFGTVRDSVIKFYDKQADNTYGDLARKMNAGELKSTNYAHMIHIDNSYAAGIENTQDAKSLMDSLWQTHVSQFGKDMYDKYCSIYGKANHVLNDGKHRIDRIAAAEALVDGVNGAFHEEIDFQR